MRSTKPSRPREQPDSGLAHLVDLKVEALKTILSTLSVFSTWPLPGFEQGNRRFIKCNRRAA